MEETEDEKKNYKLKVTEKTYVCLYIDISRIMKIAGALFSGWLVWMIKIKSFQIKRNT